MPKKKGAMGTVKLGKITRIEPQKPDRIIDPRGPELPPERLPLNIIVKPLGILPNVEEEDLLRKSRRRYNF